MPVGTTLVNLRKMLNAEVGEEMVETISPALVAVNNRLLNNQQIFLDNQNGYLRGKATDTLAATVGTRYYTPPTGVDLDRLEEPVYTNLANFRYRLEYGITQDDYNIYRSDQNVTGSPCFRWQLVNISSALKVELWPIPSTAQTLTFTGVLPLVEMTSDSSTCVIDDMALVLFTAAEILARKGAGDAGAKAAKAKAYLDKLKASFPSRYDNFNLMGAEQNYNGFNRNVFQRPTVGVNV